MNIILFICLWLIVFQCNQAHQKASSDQDSQQYSIMNNIEMKFKTAPVSMAMAGNQIFLVDLDGFFGWSKELNPPSFIHNSGLSRILVIGVGDKVATIGQWHPTLKRWPPGSKAPDMEIPVFSGKVSAIAAFKEKIWLAGADKDTSAATHPKKDHVPLFQEKIREISPEGQVVQLETGPIGRVKHLSAGDGWLLFSEQDKPETISLFKNEKTERFNFPGGQLTATASLGDKVVLGSQKGFWYFDPVTLKFQLVAKSNEDEPSPLYICISSEKIFTATSEGVFVIPEKNAVGRIGQQPYAITCLGNRLLVLWPKGELEQWNTNNYTLGNSLKLLIE